MVKTILMALLRRLKRDDIVPYAAQIAFYTSLSVIPFFTLLSGWLSSTSMFNIQGILQMLRENEAMPSATIDLLEMALSGATESIGFFSLTMLLVLWSSSRMIRSIMTAIHMAYREREGRPLLRRYLMSFGYTLLLAIGVLLLLMMTVFGDTIRRALRTLGVDSHIVSIIFTTVRPVLPLAFLFLVFWSLYSSVPCKKISAAYSLPGALLTTVFTLIVSLLFSLIISTATSQFSLIYGGLSSITLVLFWFYWYGFSLVLGMELNAVLYDLPEYKQFVVQRQKLKLMEKEQKMRRKFEKQLQEVDQS